MTALRFPANLPPEWAGPIPRRTDNRIVVVVDDDPTGTQTVHGVTVLARWDATVLAEVFASPARAVFLLANTRAMAPADAAALARSTGAAITSAESATNRRAIVVSRSDSTLRGHFPNEVTALAAGLATPDGPDFDAWVLVPMFADGGRVTVNDVHWVLDADGATPVAETPFAADETFGYRSSNLVDWVVERSAGTIPVDVIVSITLDDIRVGGPEAVRDRALTVPHGGVLIGNAIVDADMAVLVAGLHLAESTGRHFLYRTAASFVRTCAQVAPRPFLTADEVLQPGGPDAAEGNNGAGGLTIVGSHVPRSTEQLDRLLADPAVTAIELNAASVSEPGPTAQAEIARVAGAADAALAAGTDVVVFTSRELLTGADPDASLERSVAVSAGVVGVVRQLRTRPRYLIAKGGITSSDIATDGLGIVSAEVLGQIQAGVPVWRAGPESRWRSLGYVVFPGNVGTADSLVEAVQLLRPC